MKKLFVGILCLVLMTSLAGCNNDVDSNDSYIEDANFSEAVGDEPSQDNATSTMITEEGNTSELPVSRTMISSYEYLPIVDYREPENGTTNFSVPLLKALEEYGDSDDAGKIIYKVNVHIYKDMVILRVDSEDVKNEEKRLLDCGYIAAIEKGNDGSAAQGYFTLQVEKEQLMNFAAKEEYGYMIYLYDEIADL